MSTNQFPRGLKDHPARVVPQIEAIRRARQGLESVLAEWLEYAEFNGMSNEDLVAEMASALAPRFTFVNGELVEVIK